MGFNVLLIVLVSMCVGDPFGCQMTLPRSQLRISENTDIDIMIHESSKIIVTK